MFSKYILLCSDLHSFLFLCDKMPLVRVTLQCCVFRLAAQRRRMNGALGIIQSAVHGGRNDEQLNTDRNTADRPCGEPATPSDCQRGCDERRATSKDGQGRDETDELEINRPTTGCSR